jgi:putative membrane protein
MSQIRKPAAFKIGPQPPTTQKVAAQDVHQPARKPRSTALIEVIAQDDVFDQQLEVLTPELTKPVQRGWTAWTVFLGATGLLLSLAAGLWVDTLIQNLFLRSDWLGYGALGLLGLAIFALVLVIARELRGLAQLSAANELRQAAKVAAATNNATKARSVVEKLEKQLASNAQTARGRQLLAETRVQIVDGTDLIRLAEHSLLKPLDDMARTMILDSAKRVSVVTAVSPRALVDVAYVIFECARLIRRLAELYGGRPGTLGLIRLSKNVIAHLAVTGSIAVGDSLIQQLVGHGVAAKISARLGEGVINGLMTARVGISAMDLVRPMEFAAEKRPGIGDFLSQLTRIGNEKPAGE